MDTFRRTGSQAQIADSLTLLAGISWRVGDTDAALTQVAEASRSFLTSDSASGLARVLAMSSIVLLSSDDPELGTRLAGAAYRLMHEKGVMLAPVTVLHLPDPAGLAIERLGAERADELLAEGARLPIPELVDQVVAASTTRTASQARPAGG